LGLKICIEYQTPSDAEQMIFQQKSPLLAAGNGLLIKFFLFILTDQFPPPFADFIQHIQHNMLRMPV
jgi:hypothetical protein